MYFPFSLKNEQEIWVYTKPLFGLLRHLVSQNTFGAYFCRSYELKSG